MVLIVSCPTSSLISSTTSSQDDDMYYDLTTSTASFSSDGCSVSRTFHHDKTEPIPISGISSWRHDETNSSSPLERLPSPLASSAESVDSIKSSCSSRSSAEREVERAQRRHLLDLSLGKIRGDSNMPLRKHLLVFNTVKMLQRDLDMLDDEDLYCSLVGMSNDTANHDHHHNKRCHMEVDEFSWFKQRVETIGAPPKTEELKSTSVLELVQNSQNNEENTFVDECGFDCDSEANTNTWSWTNENSFFNSLKASKEEGSMFGWPATAYSNNVWNEYDDEISSISQSIGLFGLGGNSAWSQNAGSSSSSNSFDLWGAADPLGSARLDMQHLFPSQLLLQA